MIVRSQRQIHQQLQQRVILEILESNLSEGAENYILTEMVKHNILLTHDQHLAGHEGVYRVGKPVLHHES